MAGNPYNYSAPIVDPAEYCGRQAELDRAYEFVSKKACLSFVGEPRIGLTSLLRHLSSETFGDRCESAIGPLRFIYVDCTTLDGPLAVITHILTEMAPDRSVPAVSSWRALQGRLVRTLRGPEWHDRRAVILFDNFEGLGSQQGAVDFLESLRGLAEAAEMMLVTATHTELKNCCHDDVVRSPFCNIFLTEYVGLLTHDELHEFLARTSAQSGVDISPYVESILSFSGGYPFFMQMACWHYYERATQGLESEADIVDRFTTEAAPVFGEMWQRLGVSEKTVLRSVGSGDASVDVPQGLVDRGYVVDNKLFSCAFREYIAAH